MRDAIHALKYGQLHPAARRLGQMLAEAISRLDGEAPPEMIVIPVPLHRSKYRQRGFNQAHLLAMHALAALHHTHPGWRLSLASSAVVRLRPTVSQAGLSPRQRRINVRGAFVVADPQAIAKQDILLIDDIFTTGATARALAQVLMRSGAGSVWVATLGRARRMFDNQGARVSVESKEELSEEKSGSGGIPDPSVDRNVNGFRPASMYSSPHQPSF
jgi:ComF family protein